MSRVVTRVRPRMGTLLAVSVAGGGGRAVETHVLEAFELAARAEGVMNRYDPASALSRLNQAPRTGVRSTELAAAVWTARELARQLDHAFDPTVAPLLDLWRQAATRGYPPSSSQIARTLARVGAERLRVDRDHVAFDRAGMRLDLGALGKGLALDRIAAMLRQADCGPVFLNFGESSLVAIGRPARARWGVVLRDPMGGFLGEFPLRDRACSTSGSFGQTIRIGRQVASHVIDPRTGWPLRQPVQVTVLARSAVVAEAVSTALLVLGRDAIEAVGQQMEVDVCWADRTGVYTTPWFPLKRFV